MNGWWKRGNTTLRISFAVFVIVLAVSWIAGPALARPEINYQGLQELKAEVERQYELQRGPEFWAFVKQNGLERYVDNVFEGTQLMGLGEDGRPIYYRIDNANAARTSRANLLYPGAGYGYNLTGVWTNYIAVWDAGTIRTTHQEFNNTGIPRAFNQDNYPMHYHAMHVSGTIAAGGVVAGAKGMSYETYLDEYDWLGDTSEMIAAASGNTRITNHSYGQPNGWEYESGQSIPWVWYGGANDTFDREFGRYNTLSSQWDDMAYDNPYLTVCVSAGNDRGDTGPGAGGLHRLSSGGTSTMTRERDGGDDGYDCIGYRAAGKNIFTIGAVNDVFEYTGPNSVSIADFSSFGPTDDGRIKPNIVANGVNLTSTDVDSDDDYLTIGGTSMSSPSAAGTLNLLFIHYNNVFGMEPLSTTLRGIAQHTADECGPWDGPDYMYGWGLINALAAAQLIDWGAQVPIAIRELTLNDGETFTQELAPLPGEPLKISIIWNEPNHAQSQGNNDQTPMLIHDLDVRLTNTSTNDIYYPWVLGGLDDPDMPATTGDNVLDNTEQIFLADVPAGDYEVTVSHKGILALPVSYTLIISGAIDPDDPRIPVTNLAGETNFAEGTAELSWDHDGGPTFIEYMIMRDGEEVGTTTNTTYNDDMPDFGSYTYEVVSVYNEGESLLNPSVDVDFPGPSPASFFSYAIVNEPNLDIELMWEQSRANEIAYDDGDGENFITLTAAVPTGVIAAQQFTVEEHASLHDISVSMNANVAFGEFRLLVMEDTGDDVIPGDVIFTSESLEATEAGWFTYEMPERMTFEAGQDIWLAFEWLVNGVNGVNFDTSIDQQYNRGSIYADLFNTGNPVWTALDQFIQPGTYEGDLMLRGTFGYDEPIGTLGLVEFNVYRDGNLIATTTDLTLMETLPGAGQFTYELESVYQQGSAYAADLVIDSGSLDVEEEAGELPLEFSIGEAYPNPFNPSVAVPLTLASTADVNMTVYDVLGRQVAKVNLGKMNAGSHTLNWTANNVASGVYFLRVNAGPLNSTQKVVLMR
ncbi:S8 family peptidase [bacterium]|nr:S8 family peptidase [bacterium]